MNKDDKAFIREALGELKNELRGEIRSVKTELRGEIQSVKTELGGRIDELTKQVEENTVEIRHTGVLIERLEDKIDLVAENTLGLNRRVTVLEQHAGIL